MKVNFLGLAMSRKTKVCLIIAISLAALCILLYLISGFFVVKEPKAVVIPKGQLSDSVFDLQNMKYVPMSGLNRRYFFAGLPYSVDVADGEFAKVGPADFLNSEPYYFYYNVISREEVLQDAMENQLSAVLASGEREVVIDIILEETGNMNGCSGTYWVASATVLDEEPYYLCLYRLHIDESIYASENDIVVGCISKGYTTENLANLQMLAKASVETLRYDADRARELEKAKGGK